MFVFSSLLVKAIEKENGGPKKTLWQIETSKLLRSQRHAAGDEFSFLKSAKQANEIVRSLERIENERAKFPIDRRSDIAHVVGSNKRETSYRYKVGPVHEKKLHFVAKTRWPFSPRKIYNLDPESFTPLYHRKVVHSFKSRTSKTTLLSKPMFAEEISISLKKENNPDRSFRNNATLTIPKPEHKKLSNPLATEDIRIDFTASNKKKTNLFDSKDISAKSSGSSDKKLKDGILLSESGSGSDYFGVFGKRKAKVQSRSSFTKSIDKDDVLESSRDSDNIKIDAGSGAFSGLGEKYFKGSGVGIGHLRNSVGDNTPSRQSNELLANPRKNDLGDD